MTINIKTYETQNDLITMDYNKEGFYKVRKCWNASGVWQLEKENHYSNKQQAQRRFSTLKKEVTK